jgi:hypothetical protein
MSSTRQAKRTAALIAADRAAMQQAIDQVCARGGDDCVLVERKVASEGFEQAGETAAYRCQDRALRLRPWQPPPCWVEPRADGPDDGIMGWRRGELLLLRMLELGISRYHPDPQAAIAAAEKERAT